MKYEKPELVGKTAAVDSIQQQQAGDNRKGVPNYTDIVTMAFDAVASPAAYEADE